MRKRFWEVICAALPAFVFLFTANIALFVLLVLTFPFIEPGSASYYTAVISGGVIGVSLIGLVFVIRTCRKD